MAQRFFGRVLNLAELLGEKSYFLFGPRQTGKSTLIRQTLPDAVNFDLLSLEDFLAVSQNPAVIEQSIGSNTRCVVIDEIQKAPNLLDEVHRLIETRKVHFLLTGSSARKLRRGGVNLLGGRARPMRFHPLLKRELGTEFSLQKALAYGTLPSVYLSETPRKELAAYSGIYLKEEIVAEGLVRNLPSFSRLLEIAAISNGTIVNFTNLANDAQVPRTMVYEYFDILKDTLIIDELPAWRESRRRKPIVSSKYYFFDVGVASMLQGRSRMKQGTPEHGFAFGTWLLHELRSWIDYSESGETLHFWRSQSNLEVDFLIDDHTAIEIKAKQTVGNRDLRSLRALMEEETFRRYICVCLESRRRHVDGIDILPYDMFLNELWEGRYIH